MSREPLALFDSEHWVVLEADGLRGGLLANTILMTFSTGTSTSCDRIAQIAYFRSTEVVQLEETPEGFTVQRNDGGDDTLVDWSRGLAPAGATNGVNGLMAEGSTVRVLPDCPDGELHLEVSYPDGGKVFMRLTPWESIFPTLNSLIAHGVARWTSTQASGELLGAAFVWDPVDAVSRLGLRYKCGTILFQMEWKEQSIRMGERLEVDGGVPSSCEAELQPGDIIAFSAITVLGEKLPQIRLAVDSRDWHVVLKAR